MNNQTISKISFLGDIMCEKPFLDAAMKHNNNSFYGFLDPCKDLFKQSDLVVGNLETPCDPDSSLTKDMFIFNAPVPFVEALKNSGINFVTTASNHCLDRGLEGLRNTIRVLDNIGLRHTGTFSDENQDRFELVGLSNGVKVAIISYTYGTNFMDNHIYISPQNYYAINNLTPLYGGRNKAYNDMSHSIRAQMTRMIPRGFRIRVNSILGRSSKLSFIDKLQDGDFNEEEVERIRSTIIQARKQADVVVVCPHFGGQFNIRQGSYVDAFVELFSESGCDLVVGNHPHVVQPFNALSTGMKVAYSLGNVSMSLSTPYVELNHLPDCSVMLHVYLNKSKIEKISFSILIEQEEKGFITVHPAYDLYKSSRGDKKALIQSRIQIIYNRFLKSNCSDVPVMTEYEIGSLNESETV